jgi:hypothetical protein
MENNTEEKKSPKKNYCTYYWNINLNRSYPICL